MERIESARATAKNSTYDKGDGGANSTTVVLNACGASSKLRRGFPSSSHHGCYHGAPQGVASRVREKGGGRQGQGQGRVGRQIFTWDGGGVGGGGGRAKEKAGLKSGQKCIYSEIQFFGSLSSR